LIPELGPAVVGCLALAAVTEPLRHFTQGVLPHIVVIGVVGTIGLAVYALVVRTIFPAAWSDVRLLVLRVAPQLSGIGARLSTRRGRPGARAAVQPVSRQPLSREAMSHEAP
jgi:hypothetical protein